ncbi:MAG: polymer-forming cytoskeletal protein [Hyphomicrobium sp.]
MLPNFRKGEGEGSRVQPNLVANDATAPFSPRPLTPAARTDERRASSIIGADLTIKGDLLSKGEVQVDGAVEGDIHGSHVVVGSTAVINGNVLAEEVIVRGHVVGSVRSRRVMLQSTSQVEGDIFHQSLSIEQGAMFEGKSRRSTTDPRDDAVQSKPAKSREATPSVPPSLPN